VPRDFFMGDGKEGTDTCSEFLRRGQNNIKVKYNDIGSVVVICDTDSKLPLLYYASDVRNFPE